MSIKPKTICPPDYSILSLRFTECKKLGVVKGTKTLLSVDLQPFYIPITNYSLRQFKVKAGKSMRLDIDDIAEYWPLEEKYRFTAPNAMVDNSPATTHTLAVFDEYNVLLGSVNILVDITSPIALQHTFVGAVTYAVGLSSTLNPLITIEAQSVPTPAPGYENASIVITAKAKGKKYRYLLTYDTGMWAGGPYEHPGTLAQKDYKYPLGAVRGIYLYADFARADASTCTCGCLDASGDLLSNVKNYQWTWESEYLKKQYKADESGVIVNADAGDPSQVLGTSQVFQWLTTGNPFAYNLEVGELITLDSPTFNPYG